MTDNKGKKYYICIELQELAWPSPTITTEEIAEAGGWDVALGVIEVDKHNNERTLQPGEVIEIKPGHGYGRKVCWKRGLNSVEERVSQEVAALKSAYPRLKFVADGNWVLIPDYAMDEPWNPVKGDVVFQIPQNGYPGTPPYGFYVRTGITCSGGTPANYQEPAPTQPPFEGTWGVFSWAPGDGAWRPGATVHSGTNLVHWAWGFKHRFNQGR